MFGLIYILIDPRTRKIRYVGQTTLVLEERLRLHMSKQKLGKRNTLAAWLRELERLELMPAIIPIAIGTSQEHLDALEIAFLAEIGKTADLVNTHGGGRGVHAPNIEQSSERADTLGQRLMRAASAIATSSPPTESGRAKAVPRPKRVALIREMLREAKPLGAILEWASNTYPAIPGVVEAKTWKVSKGDALQLVNEARDMNALGDLQSSAVKRAERRAIYEHLLERAISRNTVASDILATKINDYMCRIDGAYDPSQLPPSTLMPLSLEDAVMAIEHASSTMELARVRGALALPEGDVIDVPEDEIETDDDGDSPTVSAN